MAIQRQRIEIHSGLDGEILVDTAQTIGELVIAGKSYGFEWTNSGLVWDKEPPYRTIIAEVAAFVESICR
jgi:hypothetical protein